MDIKILVAAIKNTGCPMTMYMYRFMWGRQGKNLWDIFRIITGDHISSKNPNYCELTGLYWAWKNLDCEYIGLCH